ncbi:MAG: S8/S53 family peptidase [Oscillospiraceae bacterium]|nr:S8/S53 family peptidase [Oscillospiraceae bacterium]
MPEETRKTVRVSVIDTGFSSKAIPAESIIPGKNYYHPEFSTEDTYGHGTAVASIILEHAPESLLVPLISNVFEDNKIHMVDNEVFAQMIRDAVDIYDCDIINISAGLVLDKKEVRNACAYAEEKGVLVVASAGNDYDVNGEAMYYPAGYETVLAVGALNKNGSEIAYFSQRGEWVDVFAIGEDVTIGTLSGNTKTSSGSSYSAAKVAAIAVNILRENPEIGLDELKRLTVDEVKKAEPYYD